VTINNPTENIYLARGKIMFFFILENKRCVKIVLSPSKFRILFQQRCGNCISFLFLFSPDNVRILYLSNSVKNPKSIAKFKLRTIPNQHVKA
jgi:hypothetical protein